MQSRLDPHVDVEVQSGVQGDLGEIHPVGADELLDSALLRRVHGEILGEIEVVDHELELYLGENGYGVVSWLRGTAQIDLVVFETHGVERAFGFTLVQLYLHEFGDKAPVETHYVAPRVQRRVGGHSLVLQRLDEVLYVAEFLDVREGVVELFAVVDVGIHSLFECFLADLFVSEVDLSAGRSEDLLDLAEGTVAHERTVGLSV